MFAGQAPADLDTEAQDVGTECLAQLQIAGLVGIEQDQRVHVAIAGVEHIAHIQPVFLAHLADPAQHVRKLTDRDRAIKAHVVVDLPHRAKSGFAAQPDARAFIGGFAFAQLDRVVTAGDGDDLLQLFVDLGIRSFDLDDQQRLAIGIARLGEGLGRADAGAVHEFDRDGQNTRLDDVGDAFPCNLVAVESHQHRPRAFGFAQDAQGGFGHDAQLPLGPADHPQQVQPRRIQMCATDLDNGAIHQDHGHAHQIVGGDAIFQAMRPA